MNRQWAALILSMSLATRKEEEFWATCKHKNNGHYPGPFWGGDEQFAILSMLE